MNVLWQFIDNNLYKSTYNCFKGYKPNKSDNKRFNINLMNYTRI